VCIANNAKSGNPIVPTNTRALDAMVELNVREPNKTTMMAVAAVRKAVSSPSSIGPIAGKGLLYAGPPPGMIRAPQ